MHQNERCLEEIAAVHCGPSPDGRVMGSSRTPPRAVVPPGSTFSCIRPEPRRSARNGHIRPAATDTRRNGAQNAARRTSLLNLGAVVGRDSLVATPATAAILPASYPPRRQRRKPLHSNAAATSRPSAGTTGQASTRRGDARAPHPRSPGSNPRRDGNRAARLHEATEVAEIQRAELRERIDADDGVEEFRGERQRPRIRMNRKDAVLDTGTRCAAPRRWTRDRLPRPHAERRADAAASTTPQ